ncbi:MAG: peptidase-C39 like family protein [Gemmatimonadota bacterium]|nr:peptidase-C39 like family protein [Gemmatimonadota bacterium]
MTAPSPVRVPILAQPDDYSCGPTSLHAVYTFHGLDLDLPRLIADVRTLKEGGTLAVFLGLDALARGFDVRLYSYNLRVFDPSWDGLPPEALLEKLRAQLVAKRKRRLRESTKAYVRFLEAGGELRFHALSVRRIQEYFDAGLPVLCGLSSTYLYGTPREVEAEDGRMLYDDVRGTPQGHFVVLCGTSIGRILIADPYQANPISGDHYYEVDPDHLVRAILLGVVTYDGNLMIVAPKGGLPASPPRGPFVRGVTDPPGPS